MMLSSRCSKTLKRCDRIYKVFHLIGIACVIATFWSIAISKEPQALGTGVTKAQGQHHQQGNNNNATCKSRKYEYPSRFYGLSSADYPGPSYLRSSSYIYGQSPRTLSDEAMYRRKLCTINGANISTGTTAMDGTNPSFVSVQRLRDIKNTKDWDELLLQRFPNAAFLVTLVFKYNHACVLRRKAVTRNYVPLPGRQEIFETELLLVDSNMQTLVQTTITDESYNPVQMDDSKVFVHENTLWVSYVRHGGGYQGNQLLSRLFVSYNNNGSFEALIRDVPYRVCCGRNMAYVPIIANTHDDEARSPLEFVTWLNPLKTGTVAISELSADNIARVLDNSQIDQLRDQHEFHGTSGSLVYLPELGEYLGIGHFHKGNGPPEAFYGHHYTHAFYTVTSAPPYTMTSLSSEFVFESLMLDHQVVGDAEIIQFASGLEVITHDDGFDYLLIGYGINDCEGAVVSVRLKTVYHMLKRLEPNTSVEQTMKRLDIFQ